MDQVKKQLIDQLTRYRQHSGADNIKKALEQSLEVIPNAEKLSIIELDVIGLISQYPDSKISDLLSHTSLTQGALSKMINRLVGYLFVEKYHHQGNQKDTYLKLTDQGSIISDTHTVFHRNQDKKISEALSKYSDQDFKIAAEIVEKINQVRD